MNVKVMVFFGVVFFATITLCGIMTSLIIGAVVFLPNNPIEISNHVTTVLSLTATFTPTPITTNTPTPTATFTPIPMATDIPTPTATFTPIPTFTNTPTPTATFTPIPMAIDTPTPIITLEPLPIFTSETLEEGYDMGVDTSERDSNWVTVNNREICMEYPHGQWGAVFITVGKPIDPPRPSQDLSAYRTMSLELKGGMGNESILIGVKDNSDPDNGKENRHTVTNLTTDWQKFEIPLSKFASADFSRVYVVIEFVFETTPKMVCARNIQYLR